MTLYLYAGCLSSAANGNQTSFKLLASDGSTVWSKAHGAVIRSAAASSDRVFFGGGRASNLTHRCYDLDGNLSWSADWGGFVYGMAIDSVNGYLFTAGASVSGNQVGRWSLTTGSGGAFYETEFGASARSVAIYRPASITYVYAAGYYSGAVSPYNFGYGVSFYTTLTDLHASTSIEQMCMDASGNIYIVGGVVSGVSLRKYNNALTQQWTANHGATIRCVAVDTGGNVYIGGDSDGTYTTRKYDSSGGLVWSKDHGATVNEIAVDSNGNVYTNGVLTGGVTTRCYNSSGTQQWAISLGVDGYALTLNDESIPPLALAGSSSTIASATGRLHVQVPGTLVQPKLVGLMRADSPLLLVPCTENLTPNLNQRYDYVDKELADVSGYNHEVLLNGSVGFATGENQPTPVPRLPYRGAPLATWTSFPEPRITTDIGPSVFVLSSAWTVECWYRRYGYTDRYYHWYFGNAELYAPVLHHAFVAQGMMEVAGDRRKRTLYSLSDTEGAIHHLAAVYDGSGTITLYVDAVVVATISQSLSTLNVQIDSRARLCWGYDGGDIVSAYLPYHAACTYAFLALYGSALSASKIAARYSIGVSAAEQVLKTKMDIRLSPNYFIGNI